MFKNLRKKIACFISPEYRNEADELLMKAVFRFKNIDEEVGKRIAETLLKMDPFEPLLKKYHGIFSDEYSYVEEKLDEPSKIGFYMWAYGQKDDRYANFLSDFIMNTAGNELIKRKDPTPERILYFRSQIANEIFRRREIGRLSSLYEDLIGKNKEQEFDKGVVVE